MRITRLDLERYGRFTGKTLHFRPDAPLHVVLGANEGGKTTALTAVSDLLFGFSTSTAYDYLHEKKALRIGAELLLRDGSCLSFRRRKGNANTILDGNDQALPEDFLASAIGTVSRDAFNREFGLTAASLRQGGDELVRAGGQLAETLTAGSSGLTELLSIKKTIAVEADELFTPRRSSSKEFYAALSRYEHADKTLRAAIVTADAMHAAEAQLETGKAEKAKIVHEHRQRSAELRQVERAIRTRKILVQIEKVRVKLQELSALPDVTQLTLQSWRAAIVDHDKCVAALASLDRLDASDISDINDLAIDEILLESGQAIDDLREGLGAIKRSREDIPKRLSELASAKDTLDDIARRLGFSTLSEMIERRPNDLALTRADALAEKRSSAEDRLSESEEALSKALSEQSDFEKSRRSVEYPDDPSVFRQRLEALSGIPSVVDRLKRETKSCDSEERDLLTTAQALVPSVRSLDELSGLPVPNLTVIEGFRESLAEAQLQKGQNDVDQKKSQLTMATLAAKIERLKRDGAQVTREDLTGTRTHRDTAFDDMKRALEEDLATRHRSFESIVVVSHQLDSITDHLLLDSERATQLQTHRDDYTDATEALTTTREQERLIEEEIAQIQANWSAVWKASQVIPAAPAEMVGWRQRLDVAVDAAKKLFNWRSDLVTLRQELDEAGSALTTLMADYGRPRDKTIAASFLYKEASAWLTELQENWATLREENAKLDAAKKAVEKARADHEKWNKAIEYISIQWAETVSVIGLPVTASPQEVRTAVSLWKEVSAPKQTYDDRTHRVTAMQSDISKFVQEVNAVAVISLPDLQGEAEAILKIGTERLARSRDAAQRRDLLHRQIEVRSQERTELDTRHQSLADLLGGARRTVGASDNVRLVEMLDQLEARYEFAKQLSEQLDALVNSGDGLTEEALRKEQIGLDFDVLPSEVERLGLEISSLLSKISDASVAISAAERAVHELSRGRNATGLARDLQEASSELAEVSRRWIIRAAAERLAGRAIEQYRASVQDPLLNHAEALFRSATGDSFSALAIDYDERDQPSLVAVRQTGEHVPINGLSEGTRDQLFLSLRLALLGMRTAEPLPFLADDLLSSFDDGRTGRTLSLLRDFGRKSQVIVFTHHFHVAEIARAISADVELIEL